MRSPTHTQRSTGRISTLIANILPGTTATKTLVISIAEAKARRAAVGERLVAAETMLEAKQAEISQFGHLDGR